MTSEGKYSCLMSWHPKVNIKTNFKLTTNTQNGHAKNRRIIIWIRYFQQRPLVKYYKVSILSSYVVQFNLKLLLSRIGILFTIGLKKKKTLFSKKLETDGTLMYLLKNEDYTISCGKFPLCEGLEKIVLYSKLIN